jgi:hypothetical protein
MTSEFPENLNENKNDYPKKKYLYINENKEDIEDCIKILTNLTKLDLNQDAINGIYLFGCDLSEETEPSEDFNAVHIMRKARKLKCFQDKIKEFVENYYISGLILMGKPKDISQKRFKFYLKIKESQEGEILEELPQNIEGKIYRFKFKKKKHDLSKMMEDKDSGEAQCVANYLNICLGKILKKCAYTKDRTSRKILYYQREEAENAVQLGLNQHYLYFPALKAVCETYEGGNIYMKLLPKHLIKTDYTYRDYFEGIGCNTLEERLEIFKNKVVNKRGITTYNQVMIKIEDVIVENPYKINFSDKSGKKWSVGKYLTDKLGIKGIYDEEMPIAVRIIDKGGKLKGEERKFIHIPCQLLAVVGNVFGDKIDIKSLIQNPNEKLKEIERIRKLIEQKSIDSQDDELHNYIGTKFDPVTIDGQIIKPPLIIFGDNQKRDINSGNHEFGNIDLRETTPYSKVRNLNKIDIYTYGLDKFQYEIIWEKLEEASKELGIKFKEKPTFYTLEMHDQRDNFQNYIQNYFNACDKFYNPNLKEKKSEEKGDENKKVDFIFLFMDRRYKERFHYSIFKSVINKFNWCIPTQVILYDEKKIKKANLSQYTNILCQMWAKQGNELYICDLNFVPQTIVIAYSSSLIKKNLCLLSVAISIGSKLYEYMFFSTTIEGTDISSALYSILYKVFKLIGKVMKKPVSNIVIYREAVNAKKQSFIRDTEIPIIKKALKDISDKLDKKLEKKEEKNEIKDEINPFKDSKWILILVSKINEIKLFLEEKQKGNNQDNIVNIPTGTLIDRVITSQDKYDFYLNSASAIQGTSSSTHYIVLYDDTKLSATQIYKLTYHLSFLSYNTTKSIRIPSPLYFVSRRNQFIIKHLNGEIINTKSMSLNISL